MRELLRAVLALGWASACTAALAQAGSFSSLDAGEQFLMIGTKDGGLILADDQGIRLAKLAGEGGPTTAAIELDGVPYWITANGRTLFTTAELGRSTQKIALTELQMARPIVRLGRWQHYVVVHSANEMRFYDPVFRRTYHPGDVLPLQVAKEARQGVSKSYWNDQGGLFVTMRRYGLRKEAAGPEEVRELGLLTAWRCEANGQWRYLGGYSCAVSDFTIDEGQPVDIKQGDKHFTAEFGTADLSNIQVGPEGIIALDANDVIRVPFLKSSWLPDRLKTAVPPKYAKSLAITSNVAWWLDGMRIVGASLEDGDTDVHLRKSFPKGAPLKLAAHGERVFALYPNDIEALHRPDGELQAQWVRYRAGASAAIARSRIHKAVVALSKNAQKGDRKAAIDLFRKAGLSTARIDKALRRPVQDIELGDLVQNGSTFAVYLGNGKIQPLGKDAQTKDLVLASDTIIFRMVDQPNVAAPATAVATGRLGALMLVGVNRPNPSLGHDMFVRVTKGTAHDRPYLPKHHDLEVAMERYLGTPYAWGGNTQQGIDCSGFVCAAFREVGIRLPRHSLDIAHANIGEVVLDTLRFGDVLFYPGPIGRRHVAIYIGNGKTIEARRHGVDYHSVSGRTATIARRFITD